MKATIIASICLVLLVGIGMQYLVVGVVSNQPINFNLFRVENWILETIYVTLLVAVGYKIGENEGR